MNNTPNPYSPPTTRSDTGHRAEAVLEGIDMLRIIIFSWEKLRIFYNILLIVPTVWLMVMASQQMGASLNQVLKSSLSFLGAANLFFLLGPIAEAYICAFWKRPPSRAYRLWIFSGGLLISAIILSTVFINLSWIWV